MRTTSVHADPHFAAIGASAAAIEHHYDVDNAFYALWLDPTRTYSCALFRDPSVGLEQAQFDKLDLIASEAQAQGAARVLDIGCGWGSMLVRLDRTHGVRQPVGLTLSRKQADHIRAEHGNRYELHVESWERHEPETPYDAIVSIGAFEHFARPTASRSERLAGYREFFASCRRWLRPGGRMCLQTICYDNAQRGDLSAFFRESVFPESDLPRPHEVLEAADRLFHVARLRNDGSDYAETLRRWRNRLRERRHEAVELVGEEVVARYLKYLSLSQISFHTRRTGLLRVTLERAVGPGAS